jgi:large subunit ribosomal protein L18
MKITKNQYRIKRHKRVRAKIKGTKDIPRISVYKSNRHIFVQLVDDKEGKTILSNAIKSTKKSALKNNKTKTAAAIGKEFAEKAKEAGVKKVVFDRGGFKYHGRIKALAEGLREGGLEF